MIAKKNRKANLERKRFAFFQIGLLVSGSLCLAAFEYTTVSDETSQITPLSNETTTLQPEPTLEDMPVKPKKENRTKVINEDDLDTMIISKVITKGGELVSGKTGIITMGGDGDDGDFDDWGLEGEDDFVHEGDVDKEPMFVGGMKAMFEWLQKEIEYPELAKQMGIQGTVFVRFVVNTNGTICEVQSAKAPHETLEKEALRVVNKMPKWIPGEQAGKQVRVRYTLPINFVQH
jgi:protein TonB